MSRRSVALALMSAAAAAAATWTFAPAAGVFQYYCDRVDGTDQDYGGKQVKAGPAFSLVGGWRGDTRALEAELAARSYGGFNAEYDASVEVRAPFYFHAAPARPYVAPAVGFARPKIESRGVNVATFGARVGGLLLAANAPVTLDVYGGYRAQLLLDKESRPDFYNELYGGVECRWAFRAISAPAPPANCYYPDTSARGIGAPPGQPPSRLSSRRGRRFHGKITPAPRPGGFAPVIPFPWWR